MTAGRDERLRLRDVRSIYQLIEPLPARLRDVLAGLVRGEAEKQIARRLGLSPNTVNRHVQRLYRRLDVRSRGELLFQLANTPEGLGPLLSERELADSNAPKERARLSANLARETRD